MNEKLPKPGSPVARSPLPLATASLAMAAQPAKSRFAATAPVVPVAKSPLTPSTRGGEARLPQMHLLVVEDDPPVRQACAEIASSLGFVVQTADSVSAARAALTSSPLDLILLDLRLPGGGGLALLEEIQSDTPDAVVMVMTAYATVTSAVEAMRIGAGDYLTKPFSIDELTTVLERAAHRRAFDLEARALRERLRSGRGMGRLIGDSPAMEKLYRILSKVATTSHPVLIVGEPGTGKDLVARSIHGNGPSAERAFIPVDCGSLDPSRIEAELFGYVKGSLPGVTGAKAGLLGSAQGGTVFLDEISELPLELQTRLFRTLQDRQFRPIGGEELIPVHARILAASSRDLPSLVETGRFRKDLYFRLNVINLQIPPLRERKSDIPLLAAHVLERQRRETGIPYTFSDDALHLLVSYEWPGNVSELEHAIERACAMSSGPILHLNDFPTQLQGHRTHTLHSLGIAGISPDSDSASRSPVLSIAELEKQAILNTIRELHGDKLMAARLLGIGKTTLYRKLKEYGLNDDPALLPHMTAPPVRAFRGPHTS